MQGSELKFNFSVGFTMPTTSYLQRTTGANILSPPSSTDWELAQKDISTRNDFRKIDLIHPRLSTFSYINDKRKWVAGVTEDCSQAVKNCYL